MNQEQLWIGYHQFFQKSANERIDIFNEISADNRAFLVKTQAERWLAVNRFRLNHEQINAVEETIQSISPEWYKNRRDYEKIEPKAEELIRKVEALLSREDVRELATRHANYIPHTVDDEND